MKQVKKVVFPAEWHPQSAVQLTWPHEDTDWQPILDEVIPCFVSIAREIVKHGILLIVCRDIDKVKRQLGSVNEQNIHFHALDSNDTWARDHGAISVFINDEPVIYDFMFNGWGLKFAANKDNLITRRLHENNAFASSVDYVNCLNFVLEGGSLESDGKGTLLTTYTCLGAPNRNDTLDQTAIERQLRDKFGLSRVLWLYHGYLAGDDTDSHVDTLARFCDEQTIAYVACYDPEDEHYEELNAMKAELQRFRTDKGMPYRLIPLPMAEKVEWNGERLPATYANFLIINGAVLMPFYDSPMDMVAQEQLKGAFPDREVIGVNCLPLIKQHGSLHCVTMQYPEGFIK